MILKPTDHPYFMKYRRTFRNYVLLVGILTFGCAVKAQQPNIVIIISDDHAYQTIGAYGSKWVQTKNIDRLAKEGAIFTKSYVTNSICGPSRAAILTGKYSNKNGFKDNENSNFDFNQDNFAKALQKVGYQTAWIGKMHLGNNTPQGFDYYSILPDQGRYYNPDFIQMDNTRKKFQGYVTDIVTDEAEKWMKKRDEAKPFCLVIGHKATHRTWMPALEDLGRYDSIKFELPSNFYDDYKTRKAAAIQDMSIARTMTLRNDLKMYDGQPLNHSGDISDMTEDQQKQWHAYYDKIKMQFEKEKPVGRALTEWKYQRYMKDYLSTAASLDRNIGKTLDYLDKSGLAKNTIVIYLSDQGFYMGEHGWFDKRWMYEQSFRTPMLMRYPGLVKPGSTIDQFLLNIDIAPTLLQAAGAAVPTEMQGLSFLPLLKKQRYTAREAIYYHYYENGEHAVSPHFGVKTNRYKLIRFYKRVEHWELFDLQNDPDELHNIYDSKAAAPIVKEMKAKLNALIKKYQDTEAAKIFNTGIKK